MKITKLSDNFTPIDKGIYFGIETEESAPTNLEVEIIDSSTSEIVATQQLREVTSATINIAPYLSRFEEYEPMQDCCTSISDAPCARYKVRINSIESEEIIVSVNSIEVGEGATMITSMPRNRRISHGESDEILIVTDCGESVYAEITANTGTQLHLEHHTTTGVSRLLLATKEFDSNVKTLDISLYCAGKIFGTLRYYVTPPIKTATRLAWLSESGSIEQYSFPLSNKTSRKVEKQTIYTSKGVETVQCRTQEVLSLASRFEPSATIEAISQIVSSTRVWRESNGQLERVEVLTHSIEQDLFGKPGSINIEICALNKEEKVW